MNMRVFLTGASGYLGSVLVEHLARLPEVESITGIALKPPTAPLPAKVTFVEMDVRSPKLGAVMAGHDVVIHTAAIVLWLANMPASERDDINLNGVRNVARAALANKVNRFIHASSMAAYDPGLAQGQTAVTEDFPIGNGQSSYYYWNSKAMAERILTEILGASAIRLAFLRPIYIIGPRCPAVGSYRKNAIRFPGRDPRRQFIHEDDVAEAFIQALRTEMSGPYNVAPDDYVRLSDVWRMVGARFVPTVPLGLARLITAIRWRWLGSPIHPSWLEDMLVDFTGNNARLKGTGWKPRFSSAEAFKSAL
jgi:nucleoside-diphosphate-sugar epimerase